MHQVRGDIAQTVVPPIPVDATRVAAQSNSNTLRPIRAEQAVLRPAFPAGECPTHPTLLRGRR